LFEVEFESEVCELLL